MKQWMEAYGVAWGAKDAQIQVKKFSSKCYTSHRRVSQGCINSLFRQVYIIAAESGRSKIISPSVLSIS